MSIFICFISRYYLLITGILLTLITILSLSPLPQLPPAVGSDKAHHFLAYAALIFPVAVSMKKTSTLFTFFISFALYSGLIEIIQPYVNRYGEWLDMAANTSGLLIGLLLAKALLYVAGRKSIPKE